MGDFVRDVVVRHFLVNSLFAVDCPQCINNEAHDVVADQRRTEGEECGTWIPQCFNFALQVLSNLLESRNRTAVSSTSCRQMFGSKRHGADDVALFSAGKTLDEFLRTL